MRVESVARIQAGFGYWSWQGPFLFGLAVMHLQRAAHQLDISRLTNQATIRLDNLSTYSTHQTLRSSSSPVLGSAADHQPHK